MKMAGRIAVVTGAGRGLGEAYARRLAEEGARVAVTDVDVEGVERVAAQIGEAALPFPLDVTSWDSVRSAAAAIEDALGPVDALVNNAGIHRLARSEELPEEWWDEIIDVNLSGTWRCCQVFGRGMVERAGGAIVNIGSVYSEVGNEGRLAYAATKTGVIGITRVLGVEWAPMGVRVNAVEPGYIDTPMVQVSLSSTTGVEQVLDRIPLGYLGSADEVARAVTFLLSDESSYVTGTTLRVDGGHLSYGGFPGVKARTPSLEGRERQT
jgi:3-oxoacyl-[acyl-carrier protein] reductase